VGVLITGKFIGLLGIQWQKKTIGAVWVLRIYQQKTKLSSSSGFGNWEAMTKLVGLTSLRKNIVHSSYTGCPNSGKNFQGSGEESTLPLLVRILIALLFELAVILKWVMVTMLIFCQILG
jgi:hypothetical protein